MGHKVVMRCVTPVMNADGSVRYQPGDKLPEGHADIDDSPHAWSLTIISDVEEAPAGRDLPENAIVDDSDPHPLSTLESEPESLADEVKPVDF